jgi:hypothetical protein
MCIASSRSSGSGSSEKAYWFSRSSRASSAYSWFSFFHMPDMRVCGASSVAKPWERMSLWMLIMRKCLCRPEGRQLESLVRVAVLAPVGFHFIMLLKSCVSCSSAHGSLCSSSCDCEGPDSCGVLGCVSRSGVEAALAFAFLRGGIAGCHEDVLVVKEGTGQVARVLQEQSRIGARVRVGLKPPKVWRHFSPTTTHLNPTLTAMEDEDAIHDVFSGAGLWEESKLFAQPDTHESALFAPLQLDSE